MGMKNKGVFFYSFLSTHFHVLHPISCYFFLLFCCLEMSESKKLSKKSSGVEEKTDEMMPKSSSEQNVGGHAEQLKRLQEKVRFLLICL